MSLISSLRDDVSAPQGLTHELDFGRSSVDLSDLDLTIDEEVFLSPGEGVSVQKIEMWTTAGTTCWSCSDCTDCTSCPCTQVCGSACNC